MGHPVHTGCCRRVDSVAQHLGGLREQERCIKRLESQVGSWASRSSDRWTLTRSSAPQQPGRAGQGPGEGHGPCTCLHRGLWGQCALPGGGPVLQIPSLSTLHTRNPALTPVPTATGGEAHGVAGPTGCPGRLSLPQVDYCTVLLSSMAQSSTTWSKCVSGEDRGAGWRGHRWRTVTWWVASYLPSGPGRGLALATNGPWLATVFRAG